MLTLKKAKSHITSQGANETDLTRAIEALRSANLLPKDDSTPLTARGITSLLIGSTSPNPGQADLYLLDYAGLSGKGVTVGAALQCIMETEASRITVTSIHFCQSFPMARIEYADGECLEFMAEEFNGKGYRQEVAISGGLIGALAMALQFDTESGWVPAGGIDAA
jgi:hypothetical protein